MFIQGTNCISPQHTFGNIDLDQVVLPEENILRVIEPKYEGIPLNILRRMGKAVRLGVGTALPLIHQYGRPDGIIIGTANGGMEDCIKFLNQIIEYDEGRLTPTNFVQSTPNAIASQIGLTTSNYGYNATHVHRGLAFENALLDAMMLAQDHPQDVFLVGGVDEVSNYNYNLERLGGWYKGEIISGMELYTSGTKGSLAGEGAAMFMVTKNSEKKLPEVQGIRTLHSGDPELVQSFCSQFIKDYGMLEALLSGENGDYRLQPFYDACESLLPESVVKLRYKHFTGEHPSTSALALWLACQFLSHERIPSHFVKSGAINGPKSILLYNTGKGEQHSFISVRI